MATRDIVIKIRTEADGTGAREVQGQIDSIGQSVGNLNDLFSGLAAGVGIELANLSAQALGRIPRILGDAFQQGILFNASLHDSEVGIANVISKFQGLDEAASRREAARAIEAIKDAEPKSAATLEQLTQGFLATFAASQSAGVTIGQNVDLVAKLSNALANANLPAQQLVQELRSIITGNITLDSQLAQTLGGLAARQANWKRLGAHRSI